MIDPANPDYLNSPVSSKRPSFDYRPLTQACTPLVTIITPFYNTDEVFHETAQCVLQQSFQQWEWLIINDGSTDPRSLAVLERYRSGDPRIQVIDQPVNRGPAAARNTGFGRARTEYAVQIDSDDLLEPTAVEKWFWFLVSYPEYAFVKGYNVGFGAQQYLWQKGFNSERENLRENALAITSMIRKSIHGRVHGFDETLRDGLEDWDFWLRCADAGHWGHTMPEYLDWYRRRTVHTDRWAALDEKRRQNFRAELQQRYPGLWKGEFPEIKPRWHMPWDAVSELLPCENRLAKRKPRVLMVLPWLTMGGADRFNLDLLQQLTERNWEVTIATTIKGDHSWLPHFARFTPDIFALQHFLRPVDFPRFLGYLILSRGIDVVMVSNSEMGYLLLPYLRSRFPSVTFCDYAHMEEEDWKNGGHPRCSTYHQEQLDLSVVSSQHLKNWMVKQGAEADRIEVCTTNVSPTQWAPNPATRASVRQQLDLDKDTPVILYAARLCPQKQPKVFAKVMHRLRERKLKFQALVAGIGPDRQWLETYLNQHHLFKCVRLLGSVNPHDMQELMAASDVFFLPSQWEGIALSIFEAMASGLAVVGADVGGQRELVTVECGLLLPRATEEIEVEQYAEALARLLADPQRRAAMGKQARARICKHFPLQSMGERMAALMDKAQRLHDSDPRPLVPKGMGAASATLAVEYDRVFRLSEWLWMERQNRSVEVPPAINLNPLLKPHRPSWFTGFKSKLANLSRTQPEPSRAFSNRDRR
jgi:glycosyltransferase involved in cell wall biosynthesis